MPGMANAGAGAGTDGAPLVLVIDDDPDALAICDWALRAEGYRTVTATSGAAGLASLERVRPALVVLDLAMPGTDGFAVARAIRARQDLADLPILIFTGLSRDAERQAMAAGGTAFCSKPIEPHEFVAAVRRLCPPARKEGAPT
jgi:CheY-like chemotaxis protein